MNVAAILAVVKLIQQYGPTLITFGYDLKKLYDFLAAHKDHPALSDAERADLIAILTTDVTKIGMDDGSTTIGDVPLPPGPAPSPNVFGEFKTLDEAKAAWATFGTDPSTNTWYILERADDGRYQLFARGVGPVPAGVQAWPVAG